MPAVADPDRSDSERQELRLLTLCVAASPVVPAVTLGSVNARGMPGAEAAAPGFCLFLIVKIPTSGTNLAIVTYIDLRIVRLIDRRHDLRSPGKRWLGGLLQFVDPHYDQGLKTMRNP
jgi:hypothetical protein